MAQKQWKDYSSKEKKMLKIVGIVLGVLVLITFISVMVNPQPQGNNQQEQKKDEPVDLNLDIKYNYQSIVIKNNETVDLKGCTMKLNSDYKRTIDLVKGEETTIVYPLLTKDDGTKFDIDAAQPKNVYIGNCNGDLSRYGYYTFN